MGKGCGAGASLPLLSPPLVPYPWGRLLKKNNKRIKKKNPKKKKNQSARPQAILPLDFSVN